MFYLNKLSYTLNINYFSFLSLEKFYYLFINENLFSFLSGFVWKNKKLYIFFDSSFLHLILFFFKNNSIIFFNSLVDIVAIDFPFKVKNRFENYTDTYTAVHIYINT